MKKFKGKNDNRTVRKQLSERAKYSVHSYKDKGGKRHESVTDFNFSERVYYGRIDHEDDPVVPDTRYLTPAPNAKSMAEMPLTLPFVKDMLDLFVNKIDQAVLIGTIPDDDPFLSDLKVYIGYRNPLLSYTEHITDVIEVFNQQYLDILQNSQEVISFDNYIQHFIRYAKILGRNFPITLTSFQKSSRSDIFTSGLCVSVADLDCSNDEEKQEFFLSKSCIGFYLNVAKQFGFHVSKNAPWILVADLESPSTKLYLKKYNLPNHKEIFRKYFIKTYTLDLNLLSQALQKGFNRFASTFEFERYCIPCGDKVKIDRIFRNKISNSNIKNNYNFKYWIPLYIDIRNYEENEPYNSPEIQRMKEKAFSFQNLLDNQRSLRYINEQFRIKHKFAEGGIPYYFERQQKRTEEK